MPATSKAQMRFMGAVAGGAIKKKGLPPSKAKEFVKGQHMKDLPEKAKHYSAHNENTSLTVQAHRKEGDAIILELGEGDGSLIPPTDSGPTSSARLVMDAKAAAQYPVGSTVVLHCVPSDEEGEAQDNQQEDAAEGDASQGDASKGSDKGDGWDSFPAFQKKED